jgi:hypothetical protein
MEHDEIIEIGIDSEERLYLVPKLKEFLFIYREAKEVSWSSDRKSLYSPKQKEWSYIHWYKQIIFAVKEQSCILSISKNVKWVSIPESLKLEILNCNSFV